MQKSLKTGPLLWRAAAGVVLSTTLITAPAVAAQADSTGTPILGLGSAEGGTAVTLPKPAALAFTQLSVGDGSTMAAIGSDGNAYMWGSNVSGKLGDGTTTARSLPVRVQAPAGVSFVSISAGVLHTAAIDTAGNAWVWGSGHDGQLGNASFGASSVPVAVQMPTGVTFTQISAGAAHTVAIGSDGKAYAWGDNFFGNLGVGNNTDSTVPLEVQLPAGVILTQISAGSGQTLALDTEGNAWAWGANYFGQLGDGSYVNRNLPVAVQGPPGVTFTEVSAAYKNSMAISSDGEAYAWGIGGSGQLGNGASSNSPAPVQMQKPAGVTFSDISAGSSHTVMIGSDGYAYAAGANGQGQLGDGSQDQRDAPIQVSAGVTFTQIDAGTTSTAAIGDDGNSYTWGGNTSGQLGNGTSASSKSIPTQITFPAVVTAVTFDGLPGTELVDNGDGTISVVTPAHAAGAVDVVVEWTVNGVAQTPVGYSGGFGYVAPVVVDPPVTLPVDPPVTPPVDPPVTPPVDPPVAPPVAPPVDTPVTPSVEPPVTPPTPPAPPAPPVTSPVDPLVDPPAPPVDPPATQPQAPPADSGEQAAQAPTSPREPPEQVSPPATSAAAAPEAIPAATAEATQDPTPAPPQTESSISFAEQDAPVAPVLSAFTMLLAGSGLVTANRLVRRSLIR